MKYQLWNVTEDIYSNNRLSGPNLKALSVMLSTNPGQPERSPFRCELMCSLRGSWPLIIYLDDQRSGS